MTDTGLSPQTLCLTYWAKFCGDIPAHICPKRQGGLVGRCDVDRSRHPAKLDSSRATIYRGCSRGDRGKLIILKYV